MPVVHDHGRLRRRLRRRRVARHQRLLPRRRRPDLPHVLRQRARRRGARAPRGPTSTSPRSAARRSGRTRPRATRRRRPTGGGGSTTSTASRRDRPRRRACRSRRSCRRWPARAPACSSRAAGWRCACAACGSPGGDRRRGAAHRAHVPGPRRAGLRRLDQRGGDAPLVAGRARLGDQRGRGRPARRRRRAGGHARPRRRTSSTAAAAATPRSSRRAGSPSPGSGTTSRGAR